MKRYIAVLTACFLLMSGCGETAVPELLEPVQVQVQTTEVRRGTVEDLAVYEGVVKPETVSCGFEAGGTVEEISVSRGDYVEAGTVLAVLACGDLEAKQTELTEQYARLEAEQAFSDREYELEAKRLSASTGEDAAAEAQLLENRYLQEQEERSAALTQLEEEIALAGRSIEQAQLLAPCAGRVLAVDTVPGAAVEAGKPVIYISDEEHLQVVTEYLGDEMIENAEEVYATLSGTRFDVTYQPYDRATYISLVTAKEELEAAFLLGDPDGAASGMFALLAVVKDSAEDTLCLPANAVFRDAQGTYVYLRDGEQQTKTAVETGLETDAMVEILSGVQEGDVVYVS